MSDRAVAGAARALREARLAQSLTVAWMAVEGSVAVAAGVAARSVALTAFGVDSGIELFSAAVLLHRLLGRTSDEARGSVTGAERRASRLVGWALWLLVAYVLASAAVTLALRLRPEGSPPGIALAAASLGVMTFLWRWRAGLAERLGSPALAADVACSVTCLWMAGATLAGLAANQLLGWWWADPVAGLALTWWLRGEAQEALEAARTDGRRD